MFLKEAEELRSSSLNDFFLNLKHEAIVFWYVSEYMPFLLFVCAGKWEVNLNNLKSMLL